MLSISQINQVNYAEVMNENLELQQKKAALRDDFLEQDNFVIRQQLYSDLKLYYKDQTDAQDSKMLYVTIDEFVSAFMSKWCAVYDKPPIIRLNEVDEKDSERFNDLMSEVGIADVLAGNLIRMKLHNTILNHVMYNKHIDQVYVENNFNVNTARVWEMQALFTEPKIVAYPTVTNNQVTWVIWERPLSGKKGQHYFTSEEPKFDELSQTIISSKIPIPGNNDTGSPDYWPWVVYRFRRHNSFWGHGNDALVQLARVVNVLLTVCNDDTVRETIRILILPSQATGTENTGGGLKTGLRHPITFGASLGQDTADPQILQAKLYNQEILDYIERLGGIVGSLHNVNEFLQTKLKQDLAGIAIRLRDEPLMRSWDNDIMVVRGRDLELVKTIVQVHNSHRHDNVINEKALETLTIDYREPRVVSDEKADWELEIAKWEKGISNPIAYVRKQNPEMDDEQARKFIQGNLKITSELLQQTQSRFNFLRRNNGRADQSIGGQD